jgi:phage protein U
MLFHASYIDPAAQLAALIAAGSDHSARALVFGNGDHRGYFVVTEIQTASTQMDAAGAPIAITVNATLRQWAPGSEIDPNAPPRQQLASKRK